MSVVSNPSFLPLSCLSDPSSHRLHLLYRKPVWLLNVYKSLRAPSEVSELTFLWCYDEYCTAVLWLPWSWLILCLRKHHRAQSPFCWGKNKQAQYAFFFFLLHSHYSVTNSCCLHLLFSVTELEIIWKFIMDSKLLKHRAKCSLNFIPHNFYIMFRFIAQETCIHISIIKVKKNVRRHRKKT